MDYSSDDQISAERIGKALHQKREQAGFPIEIAASWIGIDSDAYTRYEEGQSTPSLPELETLSYYLDSLPESFWLDDSKPEQIASQKASVNFSLIARIRQRTIGVLARQYRMEAGLTSQQCAEILHVEEVELEKFELGELPIPLEFLERLALACKHSVNDFLDHKSPVGVWAERQRTERELMQLPYELKEFVSKPINRPFIELAMRLSDMPVKQLREIAEGILEITL
jgi:transcriptional regulator with XRE-family HTH domain